MPAVRTIKIDRGTVVLDLSKQVLGLELDRPDSQEDQKEVHPTLPKSYAVTLGVTPAIPAVFVSAAALSAKAKQFDDGLYAAIEIAAQRGCGKFTGKLEFLKKAAAAVASPQVGAAWTTIAASLYFSDLDLSTCLAEEAALEGLLAAFKKDELRSKPIGFYRWSADLETIFRQDRLLQTPLFAGPDTDQLARAIASDATSAATYRAYLRLMSRLTNPLEGADLLGYLETKAPEAKIFPSSRSHEKDLVVRLFGNRSIPDGFDLMREIVDRVRAGTLSLAPKEDSGFYDHQIYALESLIAPVRAEESSRVVGNEAYADHLVELFKSIYAAARETHAKQLSMAMCGMGFSSADHVIVAPELSAEPLPTYYARRAASYRFVRGVLDEAFGADAWRYLRRPTVDGPAVESLGIEIDRIEKIFDGAAAVVRRELGFPIEDPSEPATADAIAAFRSFAASTDRDPDLSRDARMMVPVFFDVERKKTKVWTHLGWTTRSLEVSFLSRPTVIDEPAPSVIGSLARRLGFAKRATSVIDFRSAYAAIATPVFAEIYVKKILDRDEFRRHCDRFKTKAAILSNLK